VLSEVAQTVDEVVIIHRGKLIQRAAMTEVEAMAAGSTMVRSPTAGELAVRLAGASIATTDAGDGRLIVNAPPERVGEIAAEHGIVLHELSVERASLEEVFLELTGDPGERGA
jgi:ABC-2 type transport system ATP-binding protein